MRKKLSDFNTVSLIAEQYQSFSEGEDVNLAGDSEYQFRTGRSEEQIQDDDAGASAIMLNRRAKELKEIIRSEESSNEEKTEARLELANINKLVTQKRLKGEFPPADTELGGEFPRRGIEYGGRKA